MLTKTGTVKKNRIIQFEMRDGKNEDRRECRETVDGACECCNVGRVLA